MTYEYDWPEEMWRYIWVCIKCREIVELASGPATGKDYPPRWAHPHKLISFERTEEE